MKTVFGNHAWLLNGHVCKVSKLHPSIPREAVPLNEKCLNSEIFSNERLLHGILPANSAKSRHSREGESALLAIAALVKYGDDLPAA